MRCLGGRETHIPNPEPGGHRVRDKAKWSGRGCLWVHPLSPPICPMPARSPRPGFFAPQGKLTIHSLSSRGRGIPNAFVDERGHFLVWKVAKSTCVQGWSHFWTSKSTSSVSHGKNWGTLSNQRDPQYIFGTSSLYFVGNWGEGDLGRVKEEESGREKGTVLCLLLSGSCLRFRVTEMRVGVGGRFGF